MKISKNGLFQPNDFPPVPAYTAEIMHSFKPNAVLELTVPFIEDLLAERGIIVTRESIRLWYPKHSLRSWGRLCIKFGVLYSRRLKRRHPDYGDTFYVA